MQSLSLAQLRPEQRPWQRRIYMDFPWRKNSSSIQFCLLSFCSLCTSETVELAQERETFQQFIHTPSPSFNFAQLDVGEKMFTLQPHLHQRYTLRTYSFTLKHYVISTHCGYYHLVIIAHNNNDNNNKTLSELLLGALYAMSHLIFPNNTGRHHSENYFYKWENWQSEKLNNVPKYNHKIMGTRGEHNFGYANT